MKIDDHNPQLLPSLFDIYSKHEGKLSDKWESYLYFYDKLFKELRDKPINLLEIGVQNGGSLEIWAKYFYKALHILGCEINREAERLAFTDSRISLIIGDINELNIRREITQKNSSLDIIIDDGSHSSQDIVRSFYNYFPLLKNDGIYIVEDLHCSYWPEFEGGLFNPLSSMQFFKSLADIVNYEHWGFPYQIKDFLKSFENKYGVHGTLNFFSLIHSVTFGNSVCYIRKSSPNNNFLGYRMVVGNDSIIADPKNLNHTYLSSPELSSEIILAQSPVLHVEKLKQIVSEREERISDLSKTLQDRDGQIAELNVLMKDKDSQLFQLHLNLQSILGSTSYQLSRPLRKIGKYLPLPLKRAVRRLAKTAYWILTPQKTSERLKQIKIRNLKKKFNFNGLIDRNWYLQRYPDIVEGHQDPVDHYLIYGFKEGRDPNPLFDTDWYLSQNPDVANSGVNPLLHYMEFGRKEGKEQNHQDLGRDIFLQQQSELSDQLARKIQDNFNTKPLISVIMPVYNTPKQWLVKAIESVRRQIYPHWELCISDNASTNSEVRNTLEEYAALDSRIKITYLVKNGGISENSNTALSLATGEFIALLDSDDELTPDALLRVVEAINSQQDVDFIYSDECKIDDSVNRRLYHFIFKPDWSPEIMFNCMLTGHLTIYRKDIVEKVGGFRSRYDFSQDYDLALRMAEVARHIVHIERILYLWRSIPGSAAADGKAFARETNIAALDDALNRRGIPGKAIPLPHANYVRIALPTNLPLVSIIIPSDSKENLVSVLHSLLEETDYPNFEVVVVCNGQLADSFTGKWSRWPQLRFVKYDKKFNFSDKCNVGAEEAKGKIVIFYNDDVFPLQRDWIERLIEYLWVPGVGGISPKLLHDDYTIQYAGMISGTPGLCGTAYNNIPNDSYDQYLTMHNYVRNVSILSGACCALWKDVFLKVGGFDTINTPDGHSDLDLSFKLIESGYRCVYTPYALLKHIGNHSWSTKPDKYKADIFALKRWGKNLSKDPYFTSSMKQALYHDFRFKYRIYAEHLDPQKDYPGPDILFVSHELTHSGAPRMLYYAAAELLRNGGFPVVVAPIDGPMREEMINAGITVIIDESIYNNHFLFERFARNFDLVIINTIILMNVVQQLSRIPILKIIWWLHEGKILSTLQRQILSIEWKRVLTLCVSNYAKNFLPLGIPIEVLHNGIPDEAVFLESPPLPHPMTFLLAGTIEPRKGQDIFVEAIALLPQEVRRQCRFLLAGKLWEGNLAFMKSLKRMMVDIPEIKYLDLIDHKLLLRLIEETDIVVCSSRDDPFPLIAVEAAMLSRPVILSERVGLIEILRESCLVFEPESVASLSEQLLKAFESRDNLYRIGMAARSCFERELTIDKFSQRFMTLLSRHMTTNYG